MTQGRPTFATPPANTDEPQGRAAQLLRDGLQDSELDTVGDLGQAISYPEPGVLRYLDGTRLQNPLVVEKVITACYPDDPVGRRARTREILEVVAAEFTPRARELYQLYRDSSLASLDVLAQRLSVKPEMLGTWLAGSAEPDDDQVEAFVRACLSDPDAADARVRELTDGRRPHPLDAGLRRRRRSLALTALVMVLALVVVAGGAYATYRALHPGPPPCGPGVPRAADGQCIGITDGTVNLASDPAFDTVLGKIKAENDHVLGTSDPIVSIAYVLPIPKTHQQVSDQFVRELEGAYEVQLQRNEHGQSDAELGGTPRLQLLIANIGEQGLQAEAPNAQTEPIVAQLAGLTDPHGRAPVVAVAGLDLSYEGVRGAVTGIGGLKLPMVAARITGDTMAGNAKDNGFFAISPPSSAQVAAIVKYLGPQARVLIVQDTTNNDYYGPALAEEFTRQFNSVQGAVTQPDPVSFDSAGPGVQNAINQVDTAVCDAHPTAVFFAGRGPNLAQLASALGNRRNDCRDAPVNVITTSDGHLLSDALHTEAATPGIRREIAQGMMSNVTVLATAQADPQLWANQTLFSPQSHAVLDGGFDTAFSHQFQVPGQAPARVDPGGDTIMGHDAMQTIVEAIKRARGPQPDDTTEPITPGLIRQALGSSINTYEPVEGASGPIAFASSAGFAVAKNIPLTAIDATGTISVVAPSLPGPPSTG